MNYLIFSLFFSLSCGTLSVYGQKSEIIIDHGDTVNLAKDTLIRNKLVSLNLRQFEGKTVANMLKNDTVKLYQKHWFAEEPPFKLSSLYLTFARGLYLRIRFTKLKYQRRYSKSGEWSFKKILKEKIGFITLDKRFFEENVVKKYSEIK